MSEIQVSDEGTAAAAIIEAAVDLTAWAWLATADTTGMDWAMAVLPLARAVDAYNAVHA